MPLLVAIGIVIASAGRLRLEDRLVQKAGVLHAAVNPTASLQVAGVARVDNVLSSDACAVLKQHILTLRDQAVAPTAQRWAVWMGAADSRYIPGSRVRFSSALEERLTPQRSDVLLPLESGLVADALRTACARLKPVLAEAVAALPLTAVDKAASQNGIASTSSQQLTEIELVECGAIIARPGSAHQAVHADFRRDNVMVMGTSPPVLPGAAERSSAAERPNMPPRVVTFVYLQDTPTADHGPTCFLPGTANAAAHAQMFSESGGMRPGSLDGCVSELATVRAGDAVVYDASVLHFGTANTVAGNERVVLYFGLSRGGHAAECAGPTPEGWEPVDPVRFWDYC